MKRTRFERACLLLTIVFITGVGGCGNKATTEPEDPFDFIEIYVSNDSSHDFIVRVNPTSQEFPIASGGRLQLLKEAPTGSYLANPAEEYSCLSIRKSDDTVLIYQQAPVDNNVWIRFGTAYSTDFYDLVISDSDLTTSGVLDECGELTRK